MIATLRSKRQRFNESMAKWVHNSGSSIYIFLDDIPSQTGLCLNNGKAMKKSSETDNFLVLQ